LHQDGTGDKPADVLFGSFYHGRDLCVHVTILNPFTDIHKKFATQILSSSRNYADRRRAAEEFSYFFIKFGVVKEKELFAVCAFEVSGGIYLQEMKSVLKRIHRGFSERSDISYSAPLTRVVRSRSSVQCLFHITPIDCCHS
jgi:hypothetical protein